MGEGCALSKEGEISKGGLFLGGRQRRQIMPTAVTAQRGKKQFFFCLQGLGSFSYCEVARVLYIVRRGRRCFLFSSLFPVQKSYCTPAMPAPPRKSQTRANSVVFFFLHFSALSRVYFIADFDVSKILRGFFSHKTTNATVRTFSPRGD